VPTAHVQTKDGQTASGTSLNVSLTSVGAGNHIVCAAAGAVSSGMTITTSTPSATWANAAPETSCGFGGGGFAAVRLDYTENVASGSWTITGHCSSSTEITVVTSESSGVATSSSLGAHNTATTTTTSQTSLANGSITPATGSIVYTAVVDNGSPTTTDTINQSYLISNDSTSWNGSNQRCGIAHKDNVASAVNNPTWTLPGSAFSIAAVIAEFFTGGGAYVPPPVFPGVFNLDARRMIDG
jgi:hypothetical protein